jgi:hypothetical protein
MVDTIKVWECAGCGRIDHPQPCVGICTDRKAELVRASDYRAAEERVASLEAVLRRIAFTTPRAGEWESAWRALQRDAKALLSGPAGLIRITPGADSGSEPIAGATAAR